MDWQSDGIPLHPLLVHLTTVSVPVAALVAIVTAAWPAARRWLAVGAPVIALVALVSVPLATSSGEWLEHRERETALLERHTELADGLLPWSIAAFVLLTAWWGWHRFAARDERRAGTGGGHRRPRAARHRRDRLARGGRRDRSRRRRVGLEGLTGTAAGLRTAPAVLPAQGRSVTGRTRVLRTVTEEEQR
ncbi:DUF2231 domain-containing protein [Curtobacterium sp. NPDC087080]|uniref:DUF2231 domain-containing protein n=1 Tax=Curtobacterium sp. NPDC087080 TaxID=3363965 RepID=UPI0038263F43